MSASTRAAPDRDLLETTHQFPGEYIVKAFGPATPRFREDILRCAGDVVEHGRGRVKERVSSGSRRTCITITWSAQSVDEVITIYERVCRVDELLFIL